MCNKKEILSLGIKPIAKKVIELPILDCVSVENGESESQKQEISKAHMTTELSVADQSSPEEGKIEPEKDLSMTDTTIELQISEHDTDQNEVSPSSLTHPLEDPLSEDIEEQLSEKCNSGPLLDSPANLTEHHINVATLMPVTQTG
ncbi:unnamed protein product [Caretta caretta]